jgi:hypothetical protein
MIIGRVLEQTTASEYHPLVLPQKSSFGFRRYASFIAVARRVLSFRENNMHLTLLLTSLLLLVPVQKSAPASAVVTPSEATFTMSVKPRDRWTWYREDTADMKQEYRMEVTVKNEGKEYAFGFYLWKHADFWTNRAASLGSGDLTDLFAVGQKSLFEQTQPGKKMAVRGAEVTVKAKGDNVVISLKGEKDLQRVFSSKPPEVVFKIYILGEPEIVRTVRVVYK